VDDRHQVNHLGPKTRLRLSQTVARLLINADPPVSKTSLQYVWAGLHPWANKFQQSSLLNLLSAGKFSCKFFVSVFLGPLRWPKEQTSKTKIFLQVLCFCLSWAFTVAKRTNKQDNMHKEKKLQETIRFAAPGELVQQTLGCGRFNVCTVASFFLSFLGGEYPT